MEAFQWLVGEIRQSEGRAVVMHVRQFEGVTDQQLIELFNEARKEDYASLKKQAKVLEKAIMKQRDIAKPSDLYDFKKLQRQFAEIRQIDYFNSPDSKQIEAQLSDISKLIAPVITSHPEIERVAIEDYREKRWVTRPKPHVDRLACAWLIRRFINPEAVIRYAHKPEPGEVAFDMNGPGFSHSGNLCTFETMIRAFDLRASGLSLLGEVVHEIDLRDERYFHPEATGIDAILKGWLALDLSDSELEKYGIALYEGLFSTLSMRSK